MSQAVSPYAARIHVCPVKFQHEARIMDLCSMYIRGRVQGEQ